MRIVANFANPQRHIHKKLPDIHRSSGEGPPHTHTHTHTYTHTHTRTHTHTHTSRAGKNNKLNFLWPKMARLGPPFWPQNCPENVYVGVPFLRSFPGSEAHKLFFRGPKMGCFVWETKSLCAFFSSLIPHTHSPEFRREGAFRMWVAFRIWPTLAHARAEFSRFQAFECCGLPPTAFWPGCLGLAAALRH